MSLLTELEAIFRDKCEEYDSREDILRGFENGEFSCGAGCIGKLVYYYQTLGLYKKYPVETLELMQNIEAELGEFDFLKDDDTTIRINYMIWTIFEYYCYFWIQDIEELIEEEVI